FLPRAKPRGTPVGILSPLSTAFAPNRSLTPLSTAFTQTHRGVGYLRNTVRRSFWRTPGCRPSKLQPSATSHQFHSSDLPLPLTSASRATSPSQSLKTRAIRTRDPSQPPIIA